MKLERIETILGYKETSLPKATHIPTIIELLSEGAKDKPVPLTTVQLAKKLGKSQQIASKHLDELEREGLIERIHSGRQSYVKLTKKGVDSASRLYSKLDSIFRSKQPAMEVNGLLFSGLGEAAYYVSLEGYKKQFIEKLGFTPYPGTLNVRLESQIDRKIRRDLAETKGIVIEGFRDGKRTFGGAKCFASLLNNKTKCAVLVIERTSYDDTVLEIIAPMNLRKQLSLKDGDRIRTRIFLKSDL